MKFPLPNSFFVRIKHVSLELFDEIDLFVHNALVFVYYEKFRFFVIVVVKLVSNNELDELFGFQQLLRRHSVACQFLDDRNHYILI